MDDRQQREWTPADYIAMLRRRWVLILILALIGPPLGYGVSLFLPNRYTSETLVLIEPPNVPESFVPQVDIGNIGQRLGTMQQQILSRASLEPIVHKFGLDSGGPTNVSMDDVIERLQKAIEVTAVRPIIDTGDRYLPGFSVDVTWADPHTAQAVCADVTSMFIQDNLRMQQAHAEQTTQFLSAQLVQAKADLDAQDAKLAAFKSRYIGSLPDEEEKNLNVLTGLTSQLDAANQALARAQPDKSFAQSMLTQRVAAWEASQNGGDPGTLEQQLAAMQKQLANLQLRYTDDYPDVIKAKSDVARLEKRLAESANAKPVPDSPKVQKSAVEPAEITQWRTQIHTLDQLIAEKTREQEQVKKQIDLYQSRVQGSPVVEEQYKELTRGYQTALDSYNDLLKKRSASSMSGELTREQQTEQFRVLDAANLPGTPSFPNRLKFTLGGLAGGLAVGFGLMFLLEIRDTSLRTEKDIEFSLRLPVLAMVPAINPVASKKSSETAVSGLASPGLGLGSGA
jgi:polysaccharide chain length determinant protein (PEP-CTERM system associated)